MPGECPGTWLVPQRHTLAMSPSSAGTWLPVGSDGCPPRASVSPPLSPTLSFLIPSLTYPSERQITWYNLEPQALEENSQHGLRINFSHDWREHFGQLLSSFSLHPHHGGGAWKCRVWLCSVLLFREPRVGVQGSAFTTCYK